MQSCSSEMRDSNFPFQNIDRENVYAYRFEYWRILNFLRLRFENKGKRVGLESEGVKNDRREENLLGNFHSSGGKICWEKSGTVSEAFPPSGRLPVGNDRCRDRRREVGDRSTRKRSRRGRKPEEETSVETKRSLLSSHSWRGKISRITNSYLSLFMTKDILDILDIVVNHFNYVFYYFRFVAFRKFFARNRKIRDGRWNAKHDSTFPKYAISVRFGNSNVLINRQIFILDVSFIFITTFLKVRTKEINFRLFSFISSLNRIYSRL